MISSFSSLQKLHMHCADITCFLLAQEKNDKQLERGYHINRKLYLEGIILSEVMGRQRRSAAAHMAGSRMRPCPFIMTKWTFCQSFFSTGKLHVMHRTEEKKTQKKDGISCIWSISMLQCRGAYTEGPLYSKQHVVLPEKLMGFLQFSWKRVLLRVCLLLPGKCMQETAKIILQ